MHSRSPPSLRSCECKWACSENSLAADPKQLTCLSAEKCKVQTSIQIMPVQTHSERSLEHARRKRLYQEHSKSTSPQRACKKADSTSPQKGGQEHTRSAPRAMKPPESDIVREDSYSLGLESGWSSNPPKKVGARDASGTRKTRFLAL